MLYIKELAKHGFLLEPTLTERIDRLSQNEFDLMINELKNQNAFLIDAETLSRFVKPEAKIISQFQTKDKFSMQDYVNMLNRRYEFLQQILIKKVELTNFLSINKVGIGKVGIIGFVKEKTEKGDNYVLNIEDPTGEIAVVATKAAAEKINLDDVIAVSGNINNKIFFAEKILLPDIPLREPNYSFESVKVVFTNKDVEADFVIKNNLLIDFVKKKETKFEAPAILEVEGVKILLVLDVDPLDVLKKRFINKRNRDFLIEPVPDIIFNNNGVTANYKGVSILPEDTLVYLSNRETVSLVK